MNLKRKLRMGMIGGGRGAFIGTVHRMAAALDGQIELVAGCFSADPEKSKASGADLFINPARVYSTYQEMAAKEAALPADQRVDFVSIVTRNNTHYAIAKCFIEAGFNVICDKPLAFTLDEAKKLRTIVKKSGKVFALTHNYTGYPMVKEAREMVRSGKIGKIIGGIGDQSEKGGFYQHHGKSIFLYSGKNDKDKNTKDKEEVEYEGGIPVNLRSHQETKLFFIESP